MFSGLLSVAFLLLTAEGLQLHKDGNTCRTRTVNLHQGAIENCTDTIPEDNYYGTASDPLETNQENQPWESVLQELRRSMLSNGGKTSGEWNNNLHADDVDDFLTAIKSPKQGFDPFSMLYNAYQQNGGKFKWPEGFFKGSQPTAKGAYDECQHPGTIENGHLSDETSTSFSPGSILDFSCNKGYYLIGSTRLTCLLPGKWSDDKPSCVTERTCPQVSAPVAGHVNYIPPLETDEQVRTALSLPILEIDGGSLPQSMIDLMANETSQKQGKKAIPAGHYAVGTKAVFNCKSKFYRLEGSKTRMCRKNGKWSGRDTACVPECGGLPSAPMQSRPNIANGSIAELLKWPWQAGIGLYMEGMSQWVLQCGGTLINEEFVVTAAHCVSQTGTTPFPLNIVFVYLGKYYRDDNLDDQYVQYRSPKQIHIHPNYNPRQFDNDIALIWLTKPVELSDRVQPACLPSKFSTDLNVVRGNEGMIPGWGKTDDGSFLTVLNEISLPVVPPDECYKQYLQEGHHMLVTDRMYCAGVEDGHKDACGGDSGGPMLFKDKMNGRWVIEGIVSWGSPEGCAIPRQYGGYTRVYKFLNWIHLFL